MNDRSVKVNIGALAPTPKWSAGARGRFRVREPFSAYFPAGEFADYTSYLNVAGNTIKQERRTRVTLVRRRAAQCSSDHSCAFVVKSERYPFLPRIRTGFRMAKAENEFRSLLYLQQLGVGAVEAVGFGAERTALGFVRSCFVITRYLENSITLADWQQSSDPQKDSSRRRALLKRLGAIFRRLHGARFFLFTVKPKNILLRPAADDECDIYFVDTPYARTLRWWPLSRWAQSRDLGYFFGSFEPDLTDGDLASFYEGYLPDVLGRAADGLRRGISRATRAQQNRTPISRLVHALKRYLRQRSGRSRQAKSNRG